MNAPADIVWSRTIGSVLPWPADGPACEDSLWQCWTRGFRHHAAYGSARSALAALLRFRGVERLWLPAYCCAALAEAAEERALLWYGVDATLGPDLAELGQSVRSGDAVLAIDYFGRSPDAALVRLARSRPDVLWIEDRAQAMAPDGAPFGDVLLYSPRKLVGVAEGGLLVADCALPAPNGPPNRHAAQAQMARAADPDGYDPAAWFPHFGAQEAAFRIDAAPMHPATRHALRRSAAPALAARRRANAAVLGAHLGDLALWPGLAIGFAPMAFPVRVRDGAAVAASLARVGLFCARHWPSLPSDPDRFPVAHGLAGQLVSLPCDHRYDAADMLRLVAAMHATGA